jgi:hypothetical protein
MTEKGQDSDQNLTFIENDDDNDPDYRSESEFYDALSSRSEKSVLDSSDSSSDEHDVAQKQIEKLFFLFSN